LDWNAISVGESPEINGCTLFINLQIRNVGFPSVAHTWRLSIKSKSINADRIIPTFIPDGLRLWDENHKIFAQFTEANRLEERTMKPIITGDMANGWLLFKLPGIHHKQLEGSPTITIYVKDIFDHEYSFSFTRPESGEAGGPMYYPGSGPNPFFLSPKQKER
jgi:hypothetical protein